MSDYAAHTEMAVVRASDLQQYTQDGWRLIEVLHEDEHATAYEAVPVVVPPRYEHEPHEVRDRTATVSHKLSVLMFLIGRDEESALAHAHEERKKLEEKLAEAKERNINLLSHNDAAEKEMERLSILIEDWKALDDRRNTEGVQVVQQRDAMERDIAKVRKSIGDEKMNEILEKQG